MRRGIAGLLLALVALAPATVRSEEAGTSALGVDLADVQRRIAAVEADGDLAEGVRERLLELYRRTAGNLERARTLREEAAALSEAAASAPEETAALRATLARLEEIDAVVAAPDVDPEAPIEVLDQKLAEVKAELATAEARAGNMRARFEQEAARPEAVRERLALAREERAAATEAAAAALTTPEEPEAVVRARQAAAAARVAALEAEIRRLEQELLTHPARVERLGLRDALARRAVEATRARAVRIEAVVTERRRIAADAALAEARAIRRAYADSPPAVRALAERNAELSEELSGITARLERYSGEDDALLARAAALEEEFVTTRRKVELAGLTQALGRVLLERRRALPDDRAIRRSRREQETLVAELGLRQIQLSEERQALIPVAAFVEASLAGVAPEQAGTLREDLRTLAEARLELLRQALDASGALLRALGELEIAQRQLLSAVEAYDAYLARRLLWIRSSAPVNLELLPTVLTDLVELFHPARWARLGGDLAAGAARSPLTALASLLLAFAVLQRRRLLRRADTLAAPLRRVSTDRMRYSFRALAAVLAAAAAPAAFLAALALLVERNTEAAPGSLAIAGGLSWAALEYFFVRAALDLLRSEGLALRHFRWAPDAVARLRRELHWFVVALPAGIFLFRAGSALDNGTLVGGSESVGLIVVLVALELLFLRILRPHGGVLRPMLDRLPERAFARLRGLWTGALLVVPPVLLLLWLAGYGYTAGTLAIYLVHSAWLMLGIAVVRALALRWLLLVRRRVKFQAMLERVRSAQAAARDGRGGDAGDGASSEEAAAAAVDAEEPELNLAALDADSRRLLTTTLLFVGAVGLWLIWSQVLPAFSILDEVGLWTRNEVVDGEPRTLPVTLGDLVVAGIIVLATVAAARGLPSLLKFALLERLAVSASGRYTVDTLLRYTVVGIGIVAVFNALGGSWSEIQWLVAALGVGIGFGLQEIVANFVSGLIILFERPIRVGDTVTVGETSGIVTRINIRATTIRDWDLKELVVPNKEFISGRLLNWTLSDPMTRVVVTVGVAYGTDADAALEQLRQAAAEHPDVLPDPPPLVTLDRFGDDAVVLVLRAYLANGDRRLGVLSELHSAIYRRFAAAGIVIAFPQRDVHLDLGGALPVRLERRGRDEKA